MKQGSREGFCSNGRADFGAPLNSHPSWALAVASPSSRRIATTDFRRNHRERALRNPPQQPLRGPKPQRASDKLVERGAAAPRSGNRTSDNLASYDYDARGRLVQATTAAGTTTYTLNAQSQRIRKTGPGGETIFLYDLAGHLIGEANASGSITREYVWLDDTPLAILDGPQGNTRIYAVHADHLNTPRAVTDSTGKLIWRNSPVSEPFGLTPVEEDPDNDGTRFVMNLRFPGQYFDAETLLANNWNRSYDAQGGFYVQADPINTVLYRDMAAKSLAAHGLVDTELAEQLYREQPEFNHPFAYVENNPLADTDPLGLMGGGGNHAHRNPPYKPPQNNCATAECAAGVLPAKGGCRTQRDIDKGLCEMICGWVSPGPPLPMSKTSLGKSAGSWGVCKALCSNDSFRDTVVTGY